jgi:hypothetical protein
MKRYAVLAIIIALAVSIAAVGCSSSKSTTHKSTPTHTAAPTTAPTETQEANGAATATSLAFTVQVDTQGIVYTYQYRARNIGTSSLDIRQDASSDQVNVAYILKGSTQEGWAYNGEEWVEFTTIYQDFDTFWNAFSPSFSSYQNYLAEEWTGLQEWTYTIPNVGTVTYTNIEINPVLPDSVFQPE